MGFLSNLFGGGEPDKPNYVAPTLSKVQLSDFKTALDKFNSQEINFEDLQKTILSSAEKYQSALEKLSPGYKEGFDKTQQIAMSRAAGDLGADVAQKVSRTAAFKGLTSGIQGPARSTLEARDLGMTSYELQNSGVGMLGALREETRGLMPLQALNMAFTPQQIRAEDNTLAYYNNEVANRQAEWNAQVANMNAQASYEHEARYGGNPLGSLLGGAAGAGAGFLIGNAIAPGVGGLIGAGMGMSTGSGVAGAYGGAQGRGMGNMLGGLGGTLTGFGGLNYAKSLGYTSLLGYGTNSTDLFRLNPTLRTA